MPQLECAQRFNTCALAFWQSVDAAGDPRPAPTAAYSSLAA